jgi:flavodoxin
MVACSHVSVGDRQSHVERTTQAGQGGGKTVKVLVAYVSRTGNTKKVAEAIFKEIKDTKEIKDLEQVDSLEGYDLAFIGFPIEAYGPTKQAVAFLEKHGAGKKIALFITHAAPEDDERVKEWIESCKAAAASAKLVGTFDCQGELGEQVADFMLKSGDDNLVAWAKERPTTMGQPDSTRLKRAGAWAKEVMQSCH